MAVFFLFPEERRRRNVSFPLPLMELVMGGGEAKLVQKWGGEVGERAHGSKKGGNKKD